MKKLLLALLVACTAPLSAQVRVQTSGSLTGMVPDTAIQRAAKTDSLRLALAANRAADLALAARVDSLIRALASVPVPPTPPPDTTPVPPIPPPSGGGVVYFRSDWSTATGNSDAAFRDTSKPRPWTYANGTLLPGGKSSVRVTAADGRDYPTTNYLRVHHDTPSNDQWAELAFEAANNYVPTPQVGDSIGMRTYYRVVLPNTWNNDRETHGTYFVDAGQGYGWGPGALGLYQWTWTDSTWDYVLTVSDQVTPSADVYWHRAGATTLAAARLQKFTTYRIEWLYIRTGTNAFQVRSRVYTAAGVLVIDTAQLVNDFWTGTATANLATFTFTVSGAGAAYMRGFKIGTNGGIAANVDFVEYAGVAVCDGWCGPYGPGR